MIWEFLALPTPTSHAEMVRAEQEAWVWRGRWFRRVCLALAVVAAATVWLGGEWAWGGVAFEVTAAVGCFFVVEAKLQAFTGFPKRAAFYRLVAVIWYLVLLGAFTYVLIQPGVGGR